jgi:hypothetical protein
LRAVPQNRAGALGDFRGAVSPRKKKFRIFRASFAR